MGCDRSRHAKYWYQRSFYSQIHVFARVVYNTTNGSKINQLRTQIMTRASNLTRTYLCEASQPNRKEGARTENYSRINLAEVNGPNNKPPRTPIARGL